MRRRPRSGLFGSTAFQRKTRLTRNYGQSPKCRSCRPERSIIIDYLQARRYLGSTILIPADADAGREVRLWDRFFDLYVHTPMQKFVSDRMRPESAKDPVGVN